MFKINVTSANSFEVEIGIRKPPAKEKNKRVFHKGVLNQNHSY